MFSAWFWLSDIINLEYCVAFGILEFLLVFCEKVDFCGFVFFLATQKMRERRGGCKKERGWVDTDHIVLTT